MEKNWGDTPSATLISHSLLLGEFEELKHRSAMT